jgi:hypothetical protein
VLSHKALFTALRLSEKYSFTKSELDFAVSPLVFFDLEAAEKQKKFNFFAEVL